MKQVLADLRRAGLARVDAPFLSLAGPQRDFTALRLTDDLLQWAIRQHERGLESEHMFRWVSIHTSGRDRLAEEALVQHQILEQRAAMSPQDQGPWVPVVLLGALHRASRCLT